MLDAKNKILRISFEVDRNECSFLLTVNYESRKSHIKVKALER